MARKVTDEERALLQLAMRQVKPLRKAKAVKKKAIPPPLAGEVDAKRPEGASPARITPSAPAGRLPRKRGRNDDEPRTPPLTAIDRRTEQRLARGKVTIDATLDLHGLSQTRAHARLISFLTRAAGEGHRTVLVITGKGAPRADRDGNLVDEGRGVLRAAVPRWIEEAPLRDLVWGLKPAGPRQGGDGALYVLLKRPRSKD